jgi:anti-sigma B factor antagonist
MSHTRTVEVERKEYRALAALDAALLRCEGEMDEFALQHLSEELFRLSHRGVRKVVIDFSGVDHVDYRGLQPLAARARLLRSSGGDLKLCGLTPYIAAILRAAGVEDEFEMYRDADEAKASFADASVLALVR